MSLIHWPDDARLETVQFQVQVFFVLLAAAAVSLSICALVFNSSNTFRIKVYSSGEKHVAIDLFLCVASPLCQSLSMIKYPCFVVQTTIRLNCHQALTLNDWKSTKNMNHSPLLSAHLLSGLVVEKGALSDGLRVWSFQLQNKDYQDVRHDGFKDSMYEI